MKIISKLLLLIILLTSHLCYAEDIVNVPVQEITSDYGIKAWLAENSTNPIISMKITFKKAGYAYDDIPGLASMVADSLQEGTAEYSADQIADTLEEKGIFLSYNTSLEYFIVSIKSLSDNIETALELLQKMLISASFEEKAIERIRSKHLTIIQTLLEDPNYLAKRKFFEIVLHDHPYMKPKYGDEEGLKIISRQDLVSYAENHFNRVSLNISVAGDINADKLSKLLDKYFVDFPLIAKESIEIPRLSKLHIGDTSKVHLSMDIPQTVVYFGEEGIDIHDPDFYVAYVLNHIVGGHSLSSSLMEEIRKKKGLTYGIYTNLEYYSKMNLLLGSASTDYSKVDDLISSITQVFDDVKQTGISPQKLQDAKDYIVKSFVISLDTNDRVVRNISYAQNNQLGVDYVNNFCERIQAVELQDINRVLNRLLDSKKLLFVTVGKGS